MDSSSIINSLRSLTTLNLVVSTEPLDVARLLARVLKHWTVKGDVRAGTRSGMMDIRGYLSGESLVGAKQKQYQGGKAGLDALDVVLHDRRGRENSEQWVKAIDPNYGIPDQARAIRDDLPKADWSPEAQKLLDEAWRQNPRDEQLYYFMPDLWPVLSDHKVLADLQRLRDERLADERCIKQVFVVAPSLDMMPEVFRPMFDIHYDTGLTAKQAREELTNEKYGILKCLERPVTQEHLDEMIKYATGLNTSEIQRMVHYAISTQRSHSKEPDKAIKVFTSEGMVEWRAAHKPIAP